MVLVAFDYRPAMVLKAAFKNILDAELWFKLSGSGQISVRALKKHSPELYWPLLIVLFPLCSRIPL